MGPAASSLAGHIVCCLKRQGGELVVYTEKVPAMPAPAGRGTNQKAMEEAAPANCLCAERTAHYFPQGHRWDTGAGVWRGCEAMFAGLGLFLPPLHFLLMTQQLLVLVQPCAVRSSGGRSLGSESVAVDGCHRGRC